MDNSKSQFDLALDGTYNLSDNNLLHPIMMGRDFRQKQNAHILRGR